MANSTAAKRTRKVSDFPLKKHPRGYWYKYVQGRYFYFEKIADDLEGSESAKQWAAERDHIYAHGERPTGSSGGASVKQICNHWIHQKAVQKKAGELAQRTYDEYFATCLLVQQCLPPSRSAKSIGPKDFTDIKELLTSRFNINGTAKRIVQIKSIFNTAFDDGLLEDRPNFGKTFRKAKAAEFRRHRNAKGDQSLSADEVKALLAKARINGKSFILLGVQAGFGAMDCAALPQTAVQGKWLIWPRVKNAIVRRVPLWPETQQALAASIKYAQDNGESELCFINYAGNRYLADGRQSKVSKEFATIRKAAKVDETRTFYDLRRTFETVAGESIDQVAVDAIMGHTPSESNMAARYRQKISDERLIAVVNHVREWLGPIGGES